MGDTRISLHVISSNLPIKAAGPAGDDAEGDLEMAESRMRALRRVRKRRERERELAEREAQTYICRHVHGACVPTST